MTNEQIILSAVSASLSEDQIEALFKTYGEIPLHTFAYWKARGLSVKKGERAAYKLPLWMFTTRPNLEARQAAEEAGEEVHEDPHYYKKVSALFWRTQVEARA